VKDLLKKSPALVHFCNALVQEQSLLAEGMWSAPKAALISLIHHVTHKTQLVLTAGSSEDLILDDLPFFDITHACDFPSWETLPGEEIAPSPDILGRRFEILYTLLTSKKPQVIIASLQACLQKVPSPKLLKSLCFLWKKGQELSLQQLPDQLEALGYKRHTVVSDKGQYAVRGGILDLFPLSSPEPFRLEFFGNEIEEIRTFDPIGQKSVAKVDYVFICPGSEQALLNQESTTLLDYLGPDIHIVFDDLLSLEDRYIDLKNMPGANTPFFLKWEDLFEKIKNIPRLYCTKDRAEELSEVQFSTKVGRAFYTGREPLQPIKLTILNQTISTSRWNHPFSSIADFFSPLENRAACNPEEILQSLSRFAKTPLDLHFLSTTDSEEKVLKERLQTLPLPKSTHFERGYLSGGLVLADASIAFFPTTELTKKLQRRRQKWRSTYHTPPSEFHELSPGDIVVHFNHGIGRYLGIEKRANNVGVETEFLLLEFAEKSKLYVPISQTHLVSRYIGAGEIAPSFNVLGTQKWQHTKTKAVKAIIGYAQDLLQRAAAREVQGGFVYPSDSFDMESFESDFPFVPTEDQLKAVSDIKTEMMSSKGMDRLICGDVGYGKTEVAMRAAFKAVVDGKKQVAVLVPTTVLALQHYESFSERMANYPVNIGIISRFHTAKENKKTLEKAATGGLDILVGTHRLISKDVSFHDLGLIIIDEEQRFGVRAKEHLKTLKTGVDCLTLSATPIPRTLYMSIIGIKEISLINTPPQDRLPIKTIITERDATLIQNALLRELSRDGQAIFIHNRVETIFKIKDELQKLVPQAKIVIGHGQMSSDELDTVFHAFKNGSADILVATTIVENGLDIPNANTILIDRADMFGLADLYQMRGRVGRWNRPAYAYFLVPERRELPELTRKRLHALMEGSGFGGGMKIAMRDLEIRGAGDILGTEQSGQVATIGFHLYCKLLKRTIEALRKKVAPSFFETKMEFTIDARIPEDYIAEPALRIEIYHRLGETTTAHDVDDLLKELKDRFGLPPKEVLWLQALRQICLFATQHHYTLLKFDQLTFTAERLKNKQATKKTYTLPRTTKPHDFQKAIIDILKD
jgi:transcription-repair coupling factor (superfamily II helicase)